MGRSQSRARACPGRPEIEEMSRPRVVAPAGVEAAGVSVGLRRGHDKESGPNLLVEL